MTELQLDDERIADFARYLANQTLKSDEMLPIHVIHMVSEDYKKRDGNLSSHNRSDDSSPSKPKKDTASKAMAESENNDDLDFATINKIFEDLHQSKALNALLYSV